MPGAGTRGHRETEKGEPNASGACEAELVELTQRVGGDGQANPEALGQTAYVGGLVLLGQVEQGNEQGGLSFVESHGLITTQYTERPSSFLHSVH